eukprot:GHVT01055007.1.p1 GENE.GHVT01055007.1~~GHVT01055007.1.p1  ORF type:complete len:105 (+),score=9.94 GHVT01055007.1:370-684(+)
MSSDYFDYRRCKEADVTPAPFLFRVDSWATLPAAQSPVAVHTPVFEVRGEGQALCGGWNGCVFVEILVVIANSLLRLAFRPTQMPKIFLNALWGLVYCRPTTAV